MHFGHCENFELIDVDTDKKEVTAKTSVTPPPHAPGVLPPWLAEQGVNIVIAGGMGGRAIQLFEAAGVRVITGATGGSPEAIVKDFLNGSLATGANVCDHGPDHIPDDCAH